MMVRGGMMCMKSHIEFLEYGLHICRCMQLELMTAAFILTRCWHVQARPSHRVLHVAKGARWSKGSNFAGA